MRSNKVFLSLFLLIVIAIVTAPLIDGVFVKRNLYQIVNVLNQSGNIQLTVLNYDQGWFNSSAKIQVTSVKTDQLAGIKPDQLGMIQAMVKSIVFEDHITHGPLVRNPVTQQWTLAQAAIDSNFHAYSLESLAGSQQPILTFHTLLDFAGGYTTTIQSFSIARDVPGVGKMSWNGLKGTTQIQISNGAIRQTQSDMTIGAFELNRAADGLLVKTGDIAIQGNYTRQKNNLWNGKQSVYFPLVTVNAPNEDNFQVNGFRFDTQFGMSKNDLFDISLHYGIQNAILPQISFSPVNLNLSVAGLDPNILIQLGNLTSATQDQVPTLLPHLLTANTVIGASAGFQTTAGRFVSDADVRWPANTLPSSIDQVFSQANVKVNARISIAALNQIFDFIDMETKKNAPASQPVAPAPVVASSTQDSSAQLDAWVQQGKLMKEVKDQIVQLQAAQLSPEIYTSTIDGLVARHELTPDIAQSLKDTYLKPAQAQVKNTPVAKPAEALPSQQMRLFVEAALKQGTLVQDKDDYVLSVDVNQGQIMINGKPYPPVAAPAPQS